MKLKQHPDDFCVEELTDVTGGEEGTHALYRLEKVSWTTPDAMAVVRRRWKIEARRVSYGGLKDRYAHTIQYFTIFHGPSRNLTHQTVRVEYLGQVAVPFTSGDIRGNRFYIVLRALAKSEIEAAEHGLEKLRADGVPNYFDDQRFGSASGGDFVGRLMVLGRFEEALRTALTAPYEFDRRDQKRRKALLRKHWGDWQACATRLPPGDVRRIIEYLIRHPDDFLGSWTKLQPELRGLHLSAFQSHVWNRMLARWLQSQLSSEQLGMIRLQIADLPAHRHLSEWQRVQFGTTTLPLPSARVHLEPSDERLSLMESVLAEDGISLKQMQFRRQRELFFSKGERAVLCRPDHLRHEVADDDRNVGKLRLSLAFDLPRGCYATLIVKRITACRF